MRDRLPGSCEGILSCDPIARTKGIAAAIHRCFTAMAIAYPQRIEAINVLGQHVRAMFDVHRQPLDFFLLKSDDATCRVGLAKRALVRTERSAVANCAKVTFGLHGGTRIT